MKKWYSQLKKRENVLIVSILISIVSFFVIGASGEDSNIGFWIITWLASGTLGIIFLIFEYQIRKSAGKQNTSKQLKETQDNNYDISPIGSEENKEEITNIKKATESNKKFNACSEYNGVKYALKYFYRENLCFVENIEKVKLDDNHITFHLEPDNEYDPNTIAVYASGMRIGLMYKGNCRDIIVRCIKNRKYEVSGFICKLDAENNQIAVKVGFFTPLDYRVSFTTAIIKTSKKDIYDNKRQDNVDCLNEGDVVYFSEDYESEGLLVTDEYGNELGEISESASEKIKRDTNDISRIIGVVENIAYNDSGKAKVKIRIYLTEE